MDFKEKFRIRCADPHIIWTSDNNNFEHDLFHKINYLNWHVIVNKIFSEIKFKNTTQNLYYKKPLDLPSEGFPTLVDGHGLPKNYEVNLGYRANIDFGVTFYESKFNTKDYNQLQIITSFIIFLIIQLQEKFQYPIKNILNIKNFDQILNSNIYEIIKPFTDFEDQNFEDHLSKLLHLNEFKLENFNLYKEDAIGTNQLIDLYPRYQYVIDFEVTNNF